MNLIQDLDFNGFRYINEFVNENILIDRLMYFFCRICSVYIHTVIYDSLGKKQI